MLLYYPTNLLSLPVDHAGHNNRQAITRIELSIGVFAYPLKKVQSSVWETGMDWIGNRASSCTIAAMSICS